MKKKCSLKPVENGLLNINEPFMKPVEGELLNNSEPFLKPVENGLLGTLKKPFLTKDGPMKPVKDKSKE